MGEYIITSDLNPDNHIDITALGPQSPGSLISIPIMDPLVKVDDQPTMFMMLMFIAVDCSDYPGFDTFVTGVGTIPATALTKIQGDAMSVCRKADVGSCTGSFMNSTTGATTACSCMLEVSDSPQTDVDAD